MHKLKPCQPSIQNAITVLENEKQCVLRQIQMGGCDRDCIKCDLVMKDSEILEGYDTAIAVLRRAQPAACEIAEYAEDCKDCGFCAQPANEQALMDFCSHGIRKPGGEQDG